VNSSSFIWNTLVGSCGSVTLPPRDIYFETNLSNVIFKNFLKCCITLSLNRLILLFTTAIMGATSLQGVTTWFFVRLSSFCSSFKLFEHQTVRSSRLHCTLLPASFTSRSSIRMIQPPWLISHKKYIHVQYYVKTNECCTLSPNCATTIPSSNITILLNIYIFTFYVRERFWTERNLWSNHSRGINISCGDLSNKW
jgi:hypothetical protein